MYVMTSTAWEPQLKAEISFLNALNTLSILINRLATPIFFLLDLVFKSTPPQALKKKVSMDTILEFYQGGKTNSGYTLEEIWGFSDAKLESEHNFIQWLFPLKQPGMHPSSLTDDATIQAFKVDIALQEKMQRSLKVMRAFYGLDGTLKTQWITPCNHNFLRLTRMITSLKLHGLEHEAQKLFLNLEAVYKKYPEAIGENTFNYWRIAVR